MLKTEQKRHSLTDVVIYFGFWVFLCIFLSIFLCFYFIRPYIFFHSSVKCNLTFLFLKCAGVLLWIHWGNWMICWLSTRKPDLLFVFSACSWLRKRCFLFSSVCLFLFKFGKLLCYPWKKILGFLLRFFIIFFSCMAKFLTSHIYIHLSSSQFSSL